MSEDVNVNAEPSEPVGAEAVFNLEELLSATGEEKENEPESEEKEDSAGQSEEVDDEIIKAFDEGQDQEETKEEPKKEEEIGEKEKAKAKAEEPQQNEENKPSIPLELPPDLLADALYSPEALGNALNTVAQHVGKYVENYANSLAQYLQDQIQRAMVTTEVMLYLHDAAKESPEILEYPNVMRRLLQKYVGKGASNEIVKNAVSEFKAAYQKYAAMKSNGNKIVDVRAQKTPPKPPRASISGEGADAPGDVNNLGYLATVLNKTFKKE